LLSIRVNKMPKQESQNSQPKILSIALNFFFIFSCFGFIFSCETEVNINSRVLQKKTDYYSEQHRPQFHFTPETKWMNDPNGMVYYDGEYHLFYQHFPEDIVWGPMHWGHAVSKNLVHWEHLPIAFYPDSLGYYFSGSAVIDHNNTSGFGDGKTPPMIAIFTLAWEDEKGIPQRQGIAYSLDKGRTWTKYAGNPVLDIGLIAYRDPKVFWHEPSGKWIMTLVASNDNQKLITDHVKFYASDNLIDWENTGDFGYTYGMQSGKWECPELIEMPVEGTQDKKWVLIVSINPMGPNGGSGTQYFIGKFDGNTFKIDENFKTGGGRSQTLWLDYGRDNYAGVTWSNFPDSSFILIGWMSNWDYAQQVPTKRWRSAMTLPRKLSLSNTPAGIRLVSTPIEQLEKLRINERTIPPVDFDQRIGITDSLNDGLAEIFLEFKKGDRTENSKFGIIIQNDRGEQLEIFYKVSDNHFYIDRSRSGKVEFSPKFPSIDKAPRISNSDVLKMHLFIDRSSVELFADDGTVVMTETFFPNEDYTILKIYGSDGGELISGAIYELSSIWKK
jgi:fructan beta-fructosidase